MGTPSLRDRLQERAASRLISGGRLLCRWATSVGKSGVVMQYLKQIGRPVSMLVLVPEQDNIRNWQDEFLKFGVNPMGVTMACYASLHKFENTNWDLLVLDEVPHIDTPLKERQLSTVTADRVLALGAVVTDAEKATLERLYGRFEVWDIGLDKAVESGILPTPSVYVAHMRLDDRERRFVLDGRTLTAQEAYDVLSDRVRSAASAYNATKSDKDKNRMLSAGMRRKRFLGARKEEAIRAICRGLEGKGRRFLCFCSSIDLAEKLGGDSAYTSRTPRKEDLLGKFNGHELDSLYVVGKLIEGQTLKDIDCGVIGQVGGTQRITVQQCGRIMRSQNPVIYVPVFDDTKDMEFLDTVTDSIPKRYIRHFKFNPNN